MEASPLFRFGMGKIERASDESQGEGRAGEQTRIEGAERDL
jgi:hypothetical protein